MDDLDRPLPNPSYRKQPSAEDDIWETDSTFFPRPAEVPKISPDSPPPRNNRNDDWNDNGWDNDSAVGALKSNANADVKLPRNTGGGGYSPPSSMILPSPAYSDLSSARPTYYAPRGSVYCPPKKSDVNEKSATASDDWDESPGVGQRSPSPVKKLRDPSTTRLKTSKSGMEFPILKDDESIDLVREELESNSLTPNEWTVSDVKEFVMANGFGVQAIDLAKEKVDGDRMMGLSRDKLSMIRGFQSDRALLVSKLFHRLRMLIKPIHEHSSQRSFDGEFRGRGRGRGGGFPRGGGFFRGGGSEAGGRGRRTQFDTDDGDVNGWNQGRGRGGGRGRGRGRGFGRDRDTGEDTWNSIKSSASNNNWETETPRPVTPKVRPEDEDWEIETPRPVTPKVKSVDDDWEPASSTVNSATKPIRKAVDDAWDTTDSVFSSKASKIPRVESHSGNAAVIGNDDDDEWG